jgi:hypothetical protein
MRQGALDTIRKQFGEEAYTILADALSDAERVFQGGSPPEAPAA